MNTQDLKGVFGRRLRQLRQSRDLTQAALSERIGISLDYLSKIERGLASPSFFVIEKLSSHFQVSPAMLFLSPRDFAPDRADRVDDDILAYRARTFMHCVDPILISNIDAVIVDVNTVAEREFGWQARELVGRPLLSLAPDTFLAYMTEIVSLCAKGTDLRNARAALISRDGKRIPALLSLTLLRDEKNAPARLVMVARTLPAGEETPYARQNNTRDSDAT